jgi:hypothetical protein
MPKMVPMLTPASMLLEPSSGSNTTQYLPRWRPSIMIACSRSSDTSTAHLPDARSELTMISSESTSSFFCSSPVAFVSPASPTLRAGVSPTFRGCGERALQVDQARLADVGRDELARRLDRGEEKSEIARGL